MSAENMNVNGVVVPLKTTPEDGSVTTPKIVDKAVTKAKLSDEVQSSLGKADTALQEHQSLSEYRKSSEQDVIDNRKVDKIQGKGLSTNDFSNEDKEKLSGLENYDDSELRGKIADIEGVIPAQASDENQLADKAFVNSTVGTNTANYISDDGEPFTLVADLPTMGVTNNDYAFVTGTDEAGNVYFDRYKATVVGSTVTWAKEYRLNNSSFTANQWAAIQSGITSGLVAKLGALPTAEELAEALLAKYEKPTTGIPESDLSQTVRDKLNLKEVIYGYYYEGAFYEESTHETEIEPVENREYVDMTDATKPVPYLWNGEEYASMGGGGGGMGDDEGETIATAICELDEAIKLLRSGMVNHGKVLTANDIENNLLGNTGLVLSAAQGKVIADYIDRLEQTVATAICELDAYKALSRAIAPEYKLKPYALDELCMHDGLLYKCTAAITNPEVWTPAHWENTDIASIIIT